MGSRKAGKGGRRKGGGAGGRARASQAPARVSVPDSEAAPPAYGAPVPSGPSTASAGPPASEATAGPRQPEGESDVGAAPVRATSAVSAPTPEPAVAPPRPLPGPSASAAALSPAAAAPSVVRSLLVGALFGICFHVILFLVDVGLHQSAEYMGVAAEDVTGRVMELYADAIVAQQLGLLALVAALGLIPGLISGLVVATACRQFGRPRTRWGRLALLAGSLIWLHHGLLMVSMATYPAIYAPGAEQSLWLRVLLTLSVDVVPLPLIKALLLAPIAWVAVWWLRRVVAASLPRYLALPPRRQLRVAGIAGVGLGLFLALAGVALRGPAAAVPERASESSAPPNVLILAVDSLRHDALGDGASAPIAPNIARFAERATRFARAVPTVPRTYPSWASMLTGLYPHDHGIRHMFPAPPAGGRITVSGTLAETLRARGYRTAVFSDFAGDVFTRADFGFEHVEAPEFTLPSNVALGGLKLHLHFMPWFVDIFRTRLTPELLAFERLADPAIVRDAFFGWLAEDDRRPFFAVVFVSAGHFPFAAPEPFSSRYVTDPPDGPSRFLKSHFSAALNEAGATREARHLKALHEGAIAASDAALGDILGLLDARGHLAHTVVAVTADHGEGLYEHGLGTGHGDHLYGRETLEVPLLVDFPGNPRRGERVDSPVSLADLAPTLLGRLDLARAAATPQTKGIDLFGTPLTALLERPVFTEIDLWFFPPETRRLDGKRIVAVEGFDGFDADPETGQIFLDPSWEDAAIAAKHRAVFLGDRKLLYVPTRDGVRLELYAPLVDPGDREDLAAKEPETVARLSELLYTWMLRDPRLERVHEWVLPREAAR